MEGGTRGKTDELRDPVPVATDDDADEEGPDNGWPEAVL